MPRNEDLVTRSSPASAADGSFEDVGQVPEDAETFSAAAVVPAAGVHEPRPPVAVHPHMVFGAGLTDPLDYVVLLHCSFMADAGRPFTVAELVTSLRAEGIVSSNGRLVGRDAVYGAFRRLARAGFLRRFQSNEKGRFGAVRYELFRHPEYNPDWSPGATNPQVGPLTASPDAVRPAETGITAGRTAYGIAGHGDAGHGDAGHGEAAVAAGRTGYGIAGHGDAVPPVPPLGGGTTSPYPRRAPSPAGTATGKERDARSRGSDGAPPPDLAAVAEFLRGLPGDVALNVKQRRKLAPLLLETVEADGWALGEDLLRALSVSRDSSPVINRLAVMRHRVENLPPPRAAAPGGPPDPAGEPCPYHPSRLLESCPCQTAVAPGGLPGPRGAESEGPVTGEALARLKAKLGLDPSRPAGHDGQAAPRPVPVTARRLPAP